MCAFVELLRVEFLFYIHLALQYISPPSFQNQTCWSLSSYWRILMLGRPIGAHTPCCSLVVGYVPRVEWVLTVLRLHPSYFFSLWFLLSIFSCGNFFFFSWPHPQHVEVPRPGIEFKLQLQHMPQLQLCQILEPTVPGGDWTHTSAVTQDTAVGFLTHCVTVKTPKNLFCQSSCHFHQ